MGEYCGEWSAAGGAYRLNRGCLDNPPYSGIIGVYTLTAEGLTRMVADAQSVSKAFV